MANNLTLEDISDYLFMVNDQLGRDRAIALLSKYNAVNIRYVDRSCWGAFATDAEYMLRMVGGIKSV